MLSLPKWLGPFLDHVEGYFRLQEGTPGWMDNVWPPPAGLPWGTFQASGERDGKGERAEPASHGQHPAVCLKTNGL